MKSYIESYSLMLYSYLICAFIHPFSDSITGLSVGVNTRDIERIMLEFNRAWLKLIEEYTAHWSM